MQKKLIKKIPNYLTILRMCLVIPFIIIMGIAASEPSLDISFTNFNQKTSLYLVGGIIFTLAMVTDYVDGYLARKYNVVSVFGKLFDPLADKLMTTSALVILSIMNIVPFWITLVFVLRDILVDGARNLLAANGAKVEASVWGKAKTMLMSIGLAIIFFIFPIRDFDYYYLETWNWDIIWLNLVLIASAALSVISGYKYLSIVRKYL